jgi:F-type H+-transporting ATPase subunit alpha
MAAFAQFGSDLDKVTQEKLAQGERIMEILKQVQFAPFEMEEQAIILFIAINGYLIDIKKTEVNSFVHVFLNYLKVNHEGILKSIAESGKFTDEIEKELKTTVENYKSSIPKQKAESPAKK